MTNIPSAIRFLRECYREDKVRTGYWDLFGRDVLERVVVDGTEQLADGLLDHIPFAREVDHEAFGREVALRAGEYELLYGLPLVVGKARIPGGDKARRICAPLFVYPARVDDETRGFPSVEVATEGRRFNLGLFELLGGDDTNVAAELSKELAGDALDEGAMTRVVALLRECCSDLEVQLMQTYPQLLNAGELREAVRSQQDGRQGFALLPGAALGLWPKSEAVRGIVSELGAMADAATGVGVSAIGALLGDERVLSSRQDLSPPLVPAVLSHSQETAVKSARTNPLTFVNGPPGTGKSFTIAAIALDHLARGQSVLIAAQTDAAVDVIADKIEAAHGVEDCVVRAGKSEYLRRLKGELDTMLGGGRSFRRPLADEEDPVAEVAKLAKHIQMLARAFDGRRHREEAWGDLLSSSGGGFVAWVRTMIVRWKAEQAPPMWGVIERYNDLLNHLVESAAEALADRRDRRLLECLSRQRRDLLRFRKALGARKGARKEELFGEIDFSAVLGAFPIWLVKLSDVSRVLPLGEGLFDVAIIDEATQCDPAGPLPVLYRAKRSVVAGDPKQLRHLSFLSRGRQRTLGERFGVDEDAPFADYRSTSLLDLVAGNIGDESQLGFLNEHFRSAPDIISFSNERFYGGRLNVMTEVPSGKENKEDVLRVYQLKGTRAEDGVNRIEIDGVLEVLRKVISSGEATSVGVISPFRAQVEAVREAVAEELSAEEFASLVGRHSFRVGTAYAFQGDERDIMVLSLTLDRASPAAAWRYLEREDVFNVSITRAKREQHVLCSFEVGALPPGSLVRDYLVAAIAHEDRVRAGDGAGGDVAEFLRGLGCKVDAKRSVAGVLFDLVVVRGDRSLAIDLIGFRARGAKALPLGDYRMFRRAGTPVFPLPFSAWTLRREECERALADAIGVEFTKADR